MHSSSEYIAALMRERQEQAAQHNRGARVLAARRWERRAADAARRARRARDASA